MSGNRPYDPLDYATLGANIRREVETCPATPLGELALFSGAGVYAIYYTGEYKPFPAYDEMGEVNRDGQFRAPIYVGKSDQATQTGMPVQTEDPKIFNRLINHRDSILAATSTLDVRDFHCRWLVVVDTFIGLGESQMIRLYQPVWNYPLRGFGNKATGGPREAGRKSAWDTIHPGRRGVGSQPNTKTANQLLDAVREQIAYVVARIDEH